MIAYAWSLDRLQWSIYLCWSHLPWCFYFSISKDALMKSFAYIMHLDLAIESVRILWVSKQSLFLYNRKPCLGAPTQEFGFENFLNVVVKWSKCMQRERWRPNYWPQPYFQEDTTFVHFVNYRVVTSRCMLDKSSYSRPPVMRHLNSANLRALTILD